MKILLYGINYKPELTGIGKYSGELCEWLSNQGHDVRVVTAPPYYPAWQVDPGYSRWWFKKERVEGISVLRCPLYVPRSPTTIKRLFHLSSFALTSFFGLFSNLRWKPDLVVLVAPTLFCAPAAISFSRLVGAKSVIHVQDYEVDAMFGLGLAQKGGVEKIAYKVERYLLDGFDYVSTISKAMLKKAVNKGVEEKKTVFFPNWSEVSRFSDAIKNNDFLSELGIDSQKRIVLYSGNMGEKQGLESVIATADILRDRSDIQFVMVGEGGGKSKLIELAEKQKLENIIFLPLQPYDKLPTLLASVDCHLVVQRRGAADVVLPSKLTNILAVGGNAVITADPETELGILCRDYPGIAECVEPESTRALAEGILSALEKSQPNVVASEYAARNLDKAQVIQTFLNSI
ncbi:glycosyltransferase WbuB [uncultured Kushneria sp.]|uniref:glycosyltransferase WbuB n=1 Tax=uncultured Kushneria sp. TaxID=905033 RepID=UPI00261F5D57|nr:glycosyltransferase WbuB [uncultured Kushneria sp.]